MKTPASVLAVSLLLGPGCSTTRETPAGDVPPPPDGAAALAAHEASFNPAAQGLEQPHEPDPAGTPPPVDTALPLPGAPDTVQGFRVQVLITQEFDEAQEVRNKISSLMPNEWVYVVHHAPYYKVRAGNFVARQDAGTLAASLKRSGFRDSWVVPDRIVRNAPPPRQAPEE